MKKYIKKSVCFIAALFGAFLALPMVNLQASEDLGVRSGFSDGYDQSQSGVSVITEFEKFDVNEHALSLIMEYKPRLDEIREMMPETLDVYLDESLEPVSLDVDWYCVGEDYETSESFYFQFSPVWDESSYVLSEEIDLLTQAPYIAVYFRSEQSDVSTFAVTNQYYETYIFDYLTDVLGYHTAAACGAMANIYAESSFVPTNLQNTFEKVLGFTDASYTMAVDNGSYTNFVRDSAGYGLCQWTFWSRKQALLDFAKTRGKSIGDPGMQLSFLDKELMAGATGKYMKSAPNTEQGCYDVGYYFCQNFERPAQEKDEKSIVRGNLAKNYYWEEYSNSIDYSIKISGQNKPGTLKQGNSFSVTGTITSGARIRSLTAGIYDTDGKLVLGKTITPNVKSYDLKELRSVLTFQTLKPGLYRYKVSAQNAVNTKTMVEQFFIVLSTSKNVSEGTYMIIPRSNRSMAVSIEKHSNAAGSKLYQESNTGSEYHYFQIEYAGNGYYTIKNTGSGLYMESPATVGEGSRIQQNEKTGAAQQNWQIILAGDGYCILPQTNTGYAMSVEKGDAAAGAKILTTATTGAKAQKFQFIKGEINEVFRDVNKGEWYIEYLEFVFKKGLMNGNDGLFEPNHSITKAQVAQVLYNLEGKPSNSDKSVFTKLKDVYEKEWYGNSVAWAYSKGIITGDLNTKKFNPDSNVTREQLALMFYRYSVSKQLDTSKSNDLEGLKNAENVSNWAETAVKWAVGSELIGGIELSNPTDGCTHDLAPRSNATRAQVATILKRFCETYELK